MRMLWTSVVLVLLAACGSKESTEDDSEVDAGDGGGVGGDGSSGSGGSGSGAGSDGGTGSDGSDDGADGGSTGSGDGADGADGGDWGDDDGEDWGDDGVDPVPDPPEVFPEDAECTSGLVYQATAVDRSGACAEACDGELVWFAGLIVNPCSEPVTLSLYDGRVISSVSGESAESGEGFGSAGGSTGTVTEFVLAPGDYVVGYEYVGGLSTGRWDAQLNFNDGSGERFSWTFHVE